MKSEAKSASFHASRRRRKSDCRKEKHISHEAVLARAALGASSLFPTSQSNSSDRSKRAILVAECFIMAVLWVCVLWLVDSQVTLSVSGLSTSARRASMVLLLASVYFLPVRTLMFHQICLQRAKLGNYAYDGAAHVLLLIVQQMFLAARFCTTHMLQSQQAKSSRNCLKCRNPVIRVVVNFDPSPLVQAPPLRSGEALLAWQSLGTPC